jgi:hypothetical protein
MGGIEMKLYTEVVRWCIECPAYNMACGCDKAFGTFIRDSSKIPEWCPLEDVK